MDSLTLPPVSVRPERSEAKSKDALMLPVPIVQRFLTYNDGRFAQSAADGSAVGSPPSAGRCAPRPVHVTTLRRFGKHRTTTPASTSTMTPMHSTVLGAPMKWALTPARNAPAGVMPRSSM